MLCLQQFKPRSMIYSAASLLSDRSRVWVGRSVDPDVETMMQRHYGPSVGASAVVVAARHSTGHASDVPDIIGSANATDSCIMWARSCQGSLTAEAHRTRWNKS